MLAVVTGLVVLLGSGCSETVDISPTGYDGDTAVTEIAEADRGEPMSFGTTDADGTPVDSDELRGEIVVLNFWCAACALCRVEASVLETLHTEFADDVPFFCVNSRDTAETPVKTTPTTVILDRDGRVQTVILGQVDESITRTLLDEAVTGGLDE